MRKNSRVSLGEINKEDLPLPYVNYPNHYGTFITFSPTDLGDVYLCECAKKSVVSYFEYKGKLPKRNNADALRMAPLDSNYWSTILAHKSLVEKAHPLEWLKYKSGLCHKCNRVIPAMRYCLPMYGNNFIQRFGWYLNQSELEQRKAIELGKPHKQVEKELRKELGFKKVKGTWTIDNKPTGDMQLIAHIGKT